MPQKFYSSSLTKIRQHAGAADFEKLLTTVICNERIEVELAGAVEAIVLLGYVLSQQSISPHELRPQRRPLSRRVVEHEQMIANDIERVDVAPRRQGRRI